jgi:hypothetical protein
LQNDRDVPTYTYQSYWGEKREERREESLDKASTVHIPVDKKSPEKEKEK